MSQEKHETDDKTVVFTFLEVAARLVRRLDGSLSMTRGISFREYQILLELSKMHKESAMRVELAAAVGLTPSAVTRALRPLEKLGYVSTEKSERDARRSLATLTRGGRKLLSDCNAGVDSALAGLNLDSIDRDQLLEFLQGLIPAGSPRRGRPQI